MNGKNSTCKNGDDWGMVYVCFIHKIYLKNILIDGIWWNILGLEWTNTTTYSQNIELTIFKL
jgi:hypothetical protein